MRRQTSVEATGMLNWKETEPSSSTGGVQGSPRNYCHLLSKMCFSSSKCDWRRLLEERWHKGTILIYTAVTEATLGTDIWYM